MRKSPAIGRIEAGHWNTERHNVRGIAFVDDAVVVTTKLEPPIEDLDSLTPDWDMLDWSHYKYIPLNCRLAVPNFARGCPFPCSFCSQWKFWRTYRTRDPKKFVELCEELVRRDLGVKHRRRWKRRTTWRSTAILIW